MTSLISIFLLHALTSFSQEIVVEKSKEQNALPPGLNSSYVAMASSPCSSVYAVVDQPAVYQKGMGSLMEYAAQNLVSVIGKHRDVDHDVSSKINMKLTIDTQGNVIDVEFSKHHMTIDCVKALQEKLLSMKGWTAAKLNDEPVCSYYVWPIACIKWAR